MMSFLRNAGLTVGLLLMASAAALSQAPARARDWNGIPVMSDTAAWCSHLAAEVASLRRTLSGPRPSADLLAQEGRRLCSSGHVRLGITRLRVALMQLREH